MSENETPHPGPAPAISPSDIEAKDVPRRSFLRGFGILAGSAALTGMAACELPSASDDCDSDVGDPFGAASDSDPSDPVRSDSDSGDRCDSD